MKYTLTALSALLIFLLFYSTTVLAAAVDLCRNVEGQRLWIIRIKRSAKNYWEYRTKVSIDGKQKVKEIYLQLSRSHRNQKGKNGNSLQNQQPRRISLRFI